MSLRASLLSLLLCIPALLRADGGTPQIYLPDGAPPAERFAAAELAKFLGKSLHATIPVVHRYDSDSGTTLLIGYHGIKGFGRKPDHEALGDDGYVYRVRNDDLLIAGATPRGTLYGVYNYLRDYAGWEWYSIDDPGTPGGHLSRIPLPDADEEHTPRFLYRELFAPEGGDNPHAVFAARLMLNGQLGHRHARNPDENLTRMLKARQGWGVDFDSVLDIGYDNPLDDELTDRAVAAIRHVMNREGYGRPQKKLLTYAQIEHIDGSGRSDDPDVRDFAREHKADSAPLVELVRRTAERTAERFPRLRVMAQAYLWSLKPPIGLTLPDNAGVNVSPIELDWARAIDRGEYNRKYFTYLKHWRRVTDHLWVWLYSTNFSGYYQPLPTIYPMIKTLKRLDRIGAVEGIFLQDSYSTRYGSFAALHAWVYGRLLWDPGLDGDALVRQFCDGYYGPEAGPILYRYIRALHRSAAQNPANRIFTNTRITLPYLNADFLIDADRMMRRAEAKACDGTHPRFCRHVRAERLGVDLVMLLNHGLLMEEAGDRWPDRTRKAYRRRLRRVKAVVREIGAENYGESSGSFAAILSMLRHPSVAPRDGCDLLRQSPEECIDFQELGFQLADATLLYDANASDTRAASITGDSVDEQEDGSGVGIWGIQAGFQTIFPPDAQGEWDLFGLVRVTVNRDGGFGPQSDIDAFKAGVEGSDWQSYPLYRFGDEAYHLIKLSSTPVPARDVGMGVWFSPPDKADVHDPSPIRRLYVDRLIALPHDGPSNIFRLRAFDLYDRDAVMAYDPRSPYRYVARMNAVEGDEAPWAIQAPMKRLLPADEKRYDLYASLRLSAERPRPADDAVVLRMGVEGSDTPAVTVTASRLTTDAYRRIRIPGVYSRADENDTVWFQIDPDTDIPFYIDTITVVPHRDD